MIGHSNKMLAILKDSLNDRKIALKSKDLHRKEAANDRKTIAAKMIHWLELHMRLEIAKSMRNNE
jgi:hypothetical protein